MRLLNWFLSPSAAALQFQDSGATGTGIAQKLLMAAAGTHDAPHLGDGLVLAAADNTLGPGRDGQ